MLKIKHPSTMVLAGSSQSGKTHFTLNLVKNANLIFDPPPENITWCYSIFQKAYEPFTDSVNFTDIIPKADTMQNDCRRLIILDDLMYETNGDIEKLFTRCAHHKNLTIIFLTQNLFFNSKHQRTISLNTHYLVLFKAVRDKMQIRVLARQMFPKRAGCEYVMESYDDAYSVPYGYLLIDFRPETEDILRLRTNIFPGEKSYVYVAK